ncbi:hypothetical protein Poli38472_008263 [Pythium oligandrum]|uniref:ER membrane protein complex subunit 2 n=1 Tax=Pythium oligandrum TaxID=41045 RepID=A0A8K1CN06_PYTOL|nr:hypothetical protein Poli38472_008263 [Pythium oligandrum]|eukprot:TMW65621.1 hypothetical protein Poli38472_008263 [Pythium oligandrum]
MGMLEYEAHLTLAEKSGGYANYVQLLATIRKEKLRVPRVVVRFGRELLENFKWRLGADIWTIYEQVLIAALDEYENELAEKCLAALKAKFPKSARAGRLEGMIFEQRGEYAKAEEIYEEILKTNPANALIMKRRIAALKGQKKTQEVIASLNELLRNFPTDQAAWTELGETHLSIGAYRYAAFCYEELVMLNPMDSFLHNRLADIYSTIGGVDNLRVARKHYCRSIELNKSMNVRAYAALLSTTRAIAAHRSNQRNNDAEDQELNDRVHKFAVDYLHQLYADKASPEVADIAQQAFKAI